MLPSYTFFWWSTYCMHNSKHFSASGTSEFLLVGKDKGHVLQILKRTIDVMVSKQYRLYCFLGTFPRISDIGWKLELIHGKKGLPGKRKISLQYLILYCLCVSILVYCHSVLPEERGAKLETFIFETQSVLQDFLKLLIQFLHVFAMWKTFWW